jgi:hypothetical protein
MAGISRIVQEKVHRDAGRASESLRGLPRSLSRLSSGRTIETQVANASALPCLSSSVAMQDADGNFLNLPGYSKAGGPDIGS